jgi:hypothetical protein
MPKRNQGLSIFQFKNIIFIKNVSIIDIICEVLSSDECKPRRTFPYSSPANPNARYPLSAKKRLHFAFQAWISGVAQRTSCCMQAAR